MQKINFNDNWQYRHLDSNEAWTSVTLPHDAMISEERTPDADGGTNTGWYKAYDYEYTKRFTLPEEYKDKELTFEFEGVYRNPEVYLNGEKVASRPYGYTNFYVPANAFVKFGEENEIRVIARNADQPNSRWYSGAGLYRPVNLFVADKQHILLNGVKIRTLQTEPAIVEVTVKTNTSGMVEVKIEKNGKIVAQEQEDTTEDKLATFAVEVPEAELWSPDTPTLYTCTVTFGTDEYTTTFGIRKITCTHEEGFTINGKRIIIRGACIHHDNGILGARSYPEAEERKIKILKENGYNAIRSAHNPCSKSLLDACDRLGMMVMDEYCDMWYIHKTMYDYADYVMDWYEQDITDMIEKDFNHPSVIMYSLGNEVAETGQEKGIEFFKKMRDVCHRLDDERPVTTGVNIFFNLLHSMGFGVYSDEKAKKNPEKKVGSEFFNNLAGLFGDKFMKNMARLHGCDVKTRGCYAAMDVAGYNYGILRYKGDLKKYPERIILGSETFCSDAYAFWEYAKANPALIGDFVWAGMDYLGEVGIGAWEYKEYAPEFSHGVGWVSAGSGRIDLIGNPLGEALYTKVAFELEDKPQIAVVPVSHTNEKHSPSAWKFSNAIPSWSWNGLDGKKAKVEVYSRAPRVELYINGKKVGAKKFKKNCKFDFTVTYQSGEITAVALDKAGKELSRNSLFTAGNETVLSVTPEKSEVKENEVCFVRLQYTDGKGMVKPLEHKILTAKVEGGELLALGNACPFNALGFCGDKTDTYYGEALAVVKATGKTVKVTVTDGALSGSAQIKVM
jgi:beta-galactosidase